MAFTRNWDESTPLGTQDRSLADDYIRYLKVNISDRLKSQVYGFTSGENDGYPGFKKQIFKQQSAAAGTPNADEIALYSIDDGNFCGLYAKNEDGTAKQWLKRIDATTLLLNLADEVDDSTVELSSGVLQVKDDGIIFAKLGCEVDEDNMASDSAVLVPTQQSVKKYVDDQDTADHPAYTGGESHTDGSGLIMKHGVETVAANTVNDIVYEDAFPNGVRSTFASYKTTEITIPDVAGSKPKVGSELTTLQVANGDQSQRAINWIAIGY